MSPLIRRRRGDDRHRGRFAQAHAHRGRRGRARRQARRDDRCGHQQRASRPGALGRAFPGPPLGAGGLPAPVAPAVGRPALRRRVRDPRLPQAHGRCSSLIARAGQERPDGRSRRRPGGAPRAGPPGRHPRRGGAGAALAGRPPGGPRRRAHPRPEPPALAPPRARPRQSARSAQPRPRRRPGRPRGAPGRGAGHRRPDRPRARHPDPRAQRHDRCPGAREREARQRCLAHAARPARLRPAHGGQARRRDGWHRALPLSRCLCPSQRERPGAGLVRQQRAPPPEPQEGTASSTWRSTGPCPASPPRFAHDRSRRSDHARRQRSPAPRRAGTRSLPAVRPARRAGTHGREARMRGGRMRGLHGAARRRAGQGVPGAPVRRLRPGRQDGRGPRGRRDAPPGPGGVPRGRGLPVRVLHGRHGDEHGSAARARGRSRRRAGAGGASSQRVPLLHVPADPARGAPGRPAGRSVGRRRPLRDRHAAPAGGRDCRRARDRRARDRRVEATRAVGPGARRRARLVRRAAARPGRGPRAGALARGMDDERRRVAPRRRRRSRHGVHRQGRRGPGQPDGPVHPGRGCAGRAAVGGSAGHGRHRPLPVRRGHVREPVDARRRPAPASRRCGRTRHARAARGRPARRRSRGAARVGRRRPRSRRGPRRDVRGPGARSAPGGEDRRGRRSARCRGRAAGRAARRVA